MRFGLLIATLAFGLGGCAATTYESNLAFDLTQQAYATDSPAEAVVIRRVEDSPPGGW